MTREEILKIAKPILFNTDMVRAILDGKKTETRRLIKPPYFVDGNEDDPRTLQVLRTAPKGSWLYREIGEMPYPRDPYRTGHYLYVRETWSTWTDGYVYKAWTSPFPQPGRYNDKFMTWHPSIHMPKEAARIFLRVTDVRFERLRDITEEDAVKEGLYKGWRYFPTSSLAVTAKQAFMWVWDMTIKLKDRNKYGWIANPWVWVIEFERVEVQ